MSMKENSRLVWSDEQGGSVGDSGLKHARKSQKKKKSSATGLNRGGFPQDGVVRVCREKTGRGGKTVTVLYGVPGSDKERKSLLKELKAGCGCGGSLKE
jgi:translation initiation factor 1